jgi:hypothetical protein
VRNPGPTLADAIDGVRWDYDPASQVLSPLVSTARWFEGFPWDGEERDETPVPIRPGMTVVAQPRG